MMNQTIGMGYTSHALHRQYLEEWAAPVSIRPIQPGDAGPIMEMHRRLSDDSLYYRYLRPYRPSTDEIGAISSLEAKQGAALVAAVPGASPKIVGLGYYLIHPSQPDTAEPALLVEDGYQGQGIGRRLLDGLVRRAQAQDISTFTVLTHPANRPALRLLHSSPYPLESRLDYGLYEIRLSLNPEAGRVVRFPR